MKTEDAAKLATKDKSEIIIKAGLQLIPYVGGSLSTLYFDTKQEKRFKRLESFYNEFSRYVNESGAFIPQIEEHNKESIVALIEELNEKVEREHTQIKREYFRNYLLTTLTNSEADKFDEQKFFLNALSDMTMLECELLMFLNTQLKGAMIGTIKKNGIEQYAIVGAIGRLKAYGFIYTIYGQISFGNNNDDSLTDRVFMTPFGQRFISYCLS
ncbi:hypothetical protein M3194_15715 [Paenibacillus glycanilyticus]|uniref:hypothetical protein n=1 Tax=Paenibacillus glycanilyticus TaxID=126569 RepID=UPI0020403B7A|nr:hypothetical protein [Paenibacillus glycanilyticus]MCM3628791.1 hypothetical protein [Paenibacillus glycanilyticus]